METTWGLGFILEDWKASKEKNKKIHLDTNMTWFPQLFYTLVSKKLMEELTGKPIRTVRSLNAAWWMVCNKYFSVCDPENA